MKPVPYRPTQPPNRRRSLVTLRCAAVLLALTAIAPACDRSSPGGSARQHAAKSHKAGPIDLPQADQRLCTGVVVLIDTSGSMSQDVRGRDGRRTPKHRVARDALGRIIEHTGEWTRSHPDRSLTLGIYNFSSSASTILPPENFDLGRAQAALERIPGPGGGTAIGAALKMGAQALYGSGCVRKYIVCITDGENTSGPAPDRVARKLYEQTGGDVELHFVAFDTSAKKFGFLSDVNGHVVEAADGEQLAARLSDIYEKRILAEAMPAERQ